MSRQLRCDLHGETWELRLGDSESLRVMKRCKTWDQWVQVTCKPPSLGNEEGGHLDIGDPISDSRGRFTSMENVVERQREQFGTGGCDHCPQG